MYRLLIIEDDQILTKVLIRMFSSEKYEVNHSGTVKEGFESCLKELPDLVLLDINLPDGNGLDVCKKIKETPKLRHIPVVILTGDATSVENRVQGMESGAEDYVLKPFIAEELLARVAGIIKRSLKLGN